MILDYEKDLLESIANIRSDLKEIGAELRLKDKFELYTLDVELYRGIRKRGITISYIDTILDLLRNDESAVWEANLIKEKLKKGIISIREAQISITLFQNSLESN